MIAYLEKRVQRGDGCWPWTGSVYDNGYGMAHLAGQRKVAHRAVYEVLVGPIEPGLHLDHGCHNRDETCAGGKTCLHRRCVNPAHLRPVTPSENVTTGRGAPAVNLLKETCPAGHEYSHTDERGWRKCKICIDEHVVARARARGVQPSRVGAAECPHGHTYTEETTRWSQGKRYCKTCDHLRAVALAPAKVKPCRGCGGPKERGRAYKYCTACRPRTMVAA